MARPVLERVAAFLGSMQLLDLYPVRVSSMVASAFLPPPLESVRVCVMGRKTRLSGTFFTAGPYKWTLR